MNRQRRRVTAALALGPILASGAASAQDAWPTRPVKLIVPVGPGIGTDIVARLFAEELGAALRQPFIVENRGGANCMLGWQAAKAAVPNGYTLLFT